jgi:hypothetical protein
MPSHNHNVTESTGWVIMQKVSSLGTIQHQTLHHTPETKTRVVAEHTTTYNLI